MPSSYSLPAVAHSVRTSHLTQQKNLNPMQLFNPEEPTNPEQPEQQAISNPDSGQIEASLVEIHRSACWAIEKITAAAVAAMIGETQGH